MTNEERDCLIIGFAVGALVFLWVGYWLRGRVESFHTNRSVKRMREEVARRDQDDFPDVVGRGPRRSPPRPKHIPFGDLGGVPRSEQSARDLLTQKPRTIPLDKRRMPIPTLLPGPGEAACECGDSPEHDGEAAKRLAVEGAREIREDAIAALVGSGFKQATAATAVDECTLVERAGGLESWVAAAFRRITSKP